MEGERPPPSAAVVDGARFPAPRWPPPTPAGRTEGDTLLGREWVREVTGGPGQVGTRG